MANQSTDNNGQTELITDKTIELQEPSFYHVILLNDDYTPMDFVINILMQLFNKDYAQAYTITMQIHHQDRGIAGTYPKEIANEKMTQVNLSARANDFPLTSIIESI